MGAAKTGERTLALEEGETLSRTGDFAQVGMKGRWQQFGESGYMWAGGRGISKGSLDGKVKRIGSGSGVGGLDVDEEQSILILTQIHIYL